MSQKPSVNASNSPMVDNGKPLPVTIADAISAVASWTDVPPRSRSNWTSSLRTAAKISGRPIADVEMSPEGLRSMVLSVPAAALGVEKGTLSNIRSHLRRVMRRLGLTDPDDRPMSPAWAKLLRTIGEEERAAFAVFSRFATAQGIEPEAVSDHVLAEFERHLTERTLTPKPRKLSGTVLGAWNRASKKVPGWPDILLTNRRHGSAFIKPLLTFGLPFQQSVAEFGALMTSDDLLDRYAVVVMDVDGLQARPRSPVRQITADLLMDHLRWGASALLATGVPLHEITDLSRLVTPAKRVADILRFIDAQHDGKHSIQNQHVGNALRKVATYFVPMAESDLIQIRAWTKNPEPRKHTMTPKNEALVRAVLEPTTEEDLLNLPGELMEAARKIVANDPSTAASMALRAVGLAFEAVVPLRLSNIRGAEIDRHLTRSRPGGPFTQIFIPAAEAKGKRDLRYPIPPHLAKLLGEWIHHFRPHFSKVPSNHLFPGKKGVVITAQGLRDALKDATLNHIGIAISPHQHRHIAANRILRALPGAFGDAQKVLGHASVLTTERSYISVESDQAAERFDALMTSLKAKGPQGRGKRSAPVGRRP